MQPKKQLKVQYIGIFEEIDFFYWPKMHFLKEGQKIWAWVDPPPLFGQCPKENVFFSIEVFPYRLSSWGHTNSDWFIWRGFKFICLWINEKPWITEIGSCVLQFLTQWYLHVHDHLVLVTHLLLQVLLLFHNFNVPVFPVRLAQFYWPWAHIPTWKDQDLMPRMKFSFSYHSFP